MGRRVGRREGKEGKEEAYLVAHCLGSDTVFEEEGAADDVCSLDGVGREVGGVDADLEGELLGELADADVKERVLPNVVHLDLSVEEVRSSRSHGGVVVWCGVVVVWCGGVWDGVVWCGVGWGGRGVECRECG